MRWLVALPAIVLGFVPLFVYMASALMSHVARFIRNTHPRCPSDMNLLIFRASGDDADAALGLVQLAIWVGTTSVNLMIRIANWDSEEATRFPQTRGVR